ncbi:MAG: hypothetical protein ACJASL_002484, partial [Paraglaciecola sp.]
KGGLPFSCGISNHTFFAALSKAIGTQDVCLYKGIRASNRAIYMGLGSKVYYGINVITCKQFLDQRCITNIPLNKSKMGVVQQAG